MWEFRNFVLGFSLSLVSVSLTSHLLASPSHVANAYNHDANLSIDLYKKNDSIARKIVFSDIHKASLSVQEPINTASSPLTSHTSEVKLADLSLSQEVPSTSDVVYSPTDINGSEDDEILSINIDNTIPIDIENTSDATYNAEVSYGDDTDNKIALLPTEVTTDESETSFDSPWVVAQGSKHIKNKKLLEKYAPEASGKPVLDDLKKLAKNDDEVSYKVAERIKQSIIFPIPDEILNDENLTPTFISPKQTSSNPKTASTKNKKEDTSVKSSIEEPSLKIISKTTPETKTAVKEQKNSKGILDNISSWFSPSTEKEKVTSKTVKNKITPSYSSQEEQRTQDTSSTISSNDALVSFYETIQETQKEQDANKIIPSELKLSFQPDRAEISGQTLRWLKAFSEKSKEKNNYLQIRLDATAPIELQRKRLNLLYTIFMNNGVDFKKVDTVFSLTEPNTFIIRTIKIQE